MPNKVTVATYLRGEETTRPRELVYGFVREPPAPTYDHQAVVTHLAALLDRHVRRRRLGRRARAAMQAAAVDLQHGPAFRAGIDPRQQAADIDGGRLAFFRRGRRQLRLSRALEPRRGLDGPQQARAQRQFHVLDRRLLLVEHLDPLFEHQPGNFLFDRGMRFQQGDASAVLAGVREVRGQQLQHGLVNVGDMVHLEHKSVGAFVDQAVEELGKLLRMG